MKANVCKKSETLPTGIYLNIMKNIEFMQPYLEDPDIFRPESDKFNNFLIQSFCYLHSDFHYLSFLNNENLDSEIMKAAEILQIFPTNNTDKKLKLFDAMTVDDIHKFWLRFFSLFKNNDDFTRDSIFNTSWVNKIFFFKDMNSAADYLNHQFPIINGNKLNDCMVSKELDDWRKLKSESVIIPNESGCFSFDENQIVEVDIDNLISDLQQMGAMYNDKQILSQKSESQYKDFFSTFISLTKNILQYYNNFMTINSAFLQEYNVKLFANVNILSENLYFIKRCNYMVKTIKLDLKALM